jgi:GR25 family glycosyltransferase involved in LPS biosynthesis
MVIKIDKNIPIFYINLDDNIDRNKSIIDLAKKYDFKNITRVNAVNTKTIEKVNQHKNIIDKNAYDILVYNNNQKIRKNHYELTNGSIGCYASHMKIYNEIVQNNIPYALILEDDCIITSDSDFFWNKVSKFNIPENADVFFLNTLIFDEIPKDEICKIYFFILLHAYIVTYDGAKKLLDNLLPMEMQIDSKISRLAYENKINLYAYTYDDLKISQAKNETTIQSLGCPYCNMFNEIDQYKKNLTNNHDHIDVKNNKEYIDNNINDINNNINNINNNINKLNNIVKNETNILFVGLIFLFIVLYFFIRK